MKHLTYLLLCASLLIVGCNALRESPPTPAPIVEPTLPPNTTASPADAAIAQGDRLFDQNDLPGAIAAYTQAIQLEPNNAQAYNDRGYANWHASNPTAALADFNIAVTLRPDYVNALTNRSFLEYDTGDYAQVISDTNHALALDPSDDSAFVMRGNARARLGDLPGALSDFLEANRIRQARKSQ